MNNAAVAKSSLTMNPLSNAGQTRVSERKLSTRASFYLLASLTISFLAGSLAPTPLYPVYQAAWGFSALTTTEIFGVYAIVLLVTLLIAGRLSDHIGRRPVLIVAALTQAVVMGIFATATGVDHLILARVVQGIATGAALGAIGAGLVDLDRVRGPAANAIAPIAGTGLGGLISGLFVHYLPAPTVLVYAVLGVTFVLQAIAVIFVRETVTRRPGAVASLIPQLSVPAASRKPIFLAAPALVALWALGGLFASLVPALTRVTLGLNPSFASGLAVFTLATAGVVTVLAVQNWEARRVLTLGALGILLGSLGLIAAFTLHSVAGFFVATVLAGIGFGGGFQGAVRSVVPTARPHERAGVLSIVFVISYLAMGLPAVIAGYFVATYGNLLATAQEFGSVVAVLAVFALLGSALARPQGSAQHA